MIADNITRLCGHQLRGPVSGLTALILGLVFIGTGPAHGQDSTQPTILPVAPFVPAPRAVAEPSSPVEAAEPGLDSERSSTYGGSAPVEHEAIPLRRPQGPREPAKGLAFRAPSGVFRNTALSLGLVVALFLGVAWFMKKSQPRSQSALPREVVEVLGRIPVSQKQQLQLIRMGPKLLLVSSTGSQMQTLGEIDEPSQVEQMIAMCQVGKQGTISQSFRQVMGQFEREKASGFVGDSQLGPADDVSAAAPRSRRRRAWS